MYKLLFRGVNCTYPVYGMPVLHVWAVPIHPDATCDVPCGLWRIIRQLSRWRIAAYVDTVNMGTPNGGQVTRLSVRTSGRAGSDGRHDGLQGSEQREGGCSAVRQARQTGGMWSTNPTSCLENMAVEDMVVQDMARKTWRDCCCSLHICSA